MPGGSFTRRAALAGGGALLAAPSLARATLFTWTWLKAEALRLADRPFAAPLPPSSAAATLDYDALNHIAFRPDRTIAGTAGRMGIRLFPLSKVCPQPVEIALVEDGRARPLAFDRALFAGAEHIPAGAEGFSGFRVMNPASESDWLAFQGASYFRAAGAFDQYGLSARALAIDTGLATPEEFPRFTHFWLEPREDGSVTVYALLDSLSAAGAWRFACRKGADGVTQGVDFVLRFRRPVARLGLAPLTSMFWYGEGDRARATDWRPEIHDSDGLALITGAGERVWRPLLNPPRAVTDNFTDTSPRAFGLLQRDRDTDHYQDDGVFYEKRPNLWVEPNGDWGPGAVTLFAMPTRSEMEDNIAAFWTPAAPVAAGRTLEMAYRLRWTADEPAGAARVVACWRGAAGPPGSTPPADTTRLVADFIGPVLAGLTRASGVAPRVTLDRGRLIFVAAYPVVGQANRWRMIVDVTRDGRPINLRAFLARGNAALSETLLYQFL